MTTVAEARRRTISAEENHETAIAPARCQPEMNVARDSGRDAMLRDCFRNNKGASDGPEGMHQPAVKYDPYAGGSALFLKKPAGYFLIGNRGDPQAPMRSILGNATSYRPQFGFSPGELQSTLDRVNDGAIVVFETTSKAANGLRSDHAYTVVSCDDRTATLRNPIDGSLHRVRYDDLAASAKAVTSATVPS